MSDVTSDAAIDFGSTVEQVGLPLLITRPHQHDNVVVYANRAFQELCGYAREEILGRDCRFLQGPETDRSVVAEIRQAIVAGQPIRREILNYRKNGEPFWNELSLNPCRDSAGHLVGFAGVQNDVTGRHRAEQALHETTAWLDGLIENIPGYVYRRVLKPDGTLEYLYVSPSFARLVKVPVQEVSGSDFWRFMHPEDAAETDRAIRRSAAAMSPLSLEFRVVGPEGDERWIRSHANPRRGGEGIIWDTVAIDITREKSNEARLSFLAFHDPLTGLPNRSLFAQSLQKAISLLAGDDRLALFHVDLSGLQEINDAMGRIAGDAILRLIGGRLAGLAAGLSGAAVARVGGDEFSLHCAVPSEAAAAELAAALSLSLAEPSLIDGKEFHTKAHIGYTALTAAGSAAPGRDRPAELMRQADVALSYAKRHGSGLACRYERDADDNVRHRMLLKQSLQRALVEQQFEVHYQPLVELASGRIVGAEALVRWPHPQLGMQRPDAFIPLAEDTGLIVPLGEWIAREAMRQSQSRGAAGLPQCTVSINISGKQLLNRGLPETLERALGEYGGNAEDFELELTEGVLVDSSKDTLTELERLKRLGFTLVVDDFGAGYSSLRYLKQFPVDKLKIDQTFIRRMVVGSSDASIVRAIIAMAKSLGLAVVAEGIETTTQSDFLRNEGCRVGQGYLYSRPLPAEAFAALLQSRSVLSGMSGALPPKLVMAGPEVRRMAAVQ